jgi:hypothetical protein
MFDVDYETEKAFADGRSDTTMPVATRKPEPSEPKKPHPLDALPMVALHKRLLGYYENELDRQAENRMDMAIDADFYDNIQWRAEDAQALKERGQVPLCYNVVSTAINWVLGSEKRGRTDYKILPRRKDAAKPAERKTQLMKYLSDVNMTPFRRSQAFEDAVKVGIGWMESAVQDDLDGEPVTMRYESWRNMLWDSSCGKDMEDCRYQIRSKWLDLDVAGAIFPDRLGVLTRSAGGVDHYGLNQLGDEAMDSQEDTLNGFMSNRATIDGIVRDRVRVIEVWFKKPVKVMTLRGSDFHGEVYDEKNPAAVHREAIDRGEAVPVLRTMMRVHVALMCDVGMLYCDQSPYRHNEFPFTPIWCYRRDRDGLPYGMIRGMRDIQEDINKRASKALYILSTNKVLMEEGAVDDVDEFAEENARPDAVLVYKKGYKVELGVDRELAPAHLDFMARGIQMIQQVSGVTDENMGRTTNATSGVAIGRRQDQGMMATAGIFDNLRLAVQLHGQKELSLIEQYFGEKKSFRITNMRGTPEYIDVNDGLPQNDIVRSRADFIISDSDWRASVRAAQTEELFALLQQLAPVAPQIALVMLDLIVEGMDITSREEIVKRIRQVTGMRDPDQEELTPEEQAAQQAKDQAEQQQQEIAMRAQLAEIAAKEAKAGRDQAETQKVQATIRQIMGAVAGQGVTTQKAALEAALLALQAPGAVRVADAMLHESNFVSRSEEEDLATMAEQAAAAQQMQQQEQQQAGAEQQAAQAQQSQPQPQAFGLPQ